MTADENTIRFHCQCGREVSAPANMAGKKGTCPSCGDSRRIPQPGIDPYERRANNPPVGLVAPSTGSNAGASAVYAHDPNPEMSKMNRLLSFVKSNRNSVAAALFMAFAAVQLIRLDARSAAIRSSIDTVERRLASIERDASSIERDASSIERDVSSIERDVSSIKRDVSSIEGEVSSIELEISTTLLEVQSIGRDVSSIEGEVDTIDSNVRSIKRRLNIP